MTRGTSDTNPPHGPRNTQHEPPDKPPTTCNLDPLRDKGGDALAPDPNHGILHVSLSRLETRLPSPLAITTVTHSDDLLATGSLLPPIPVGAAITAATLDFQLAETELPVTAELRPPYTIIIRASTAVAARIWHWLVAAGIALTNGAAILALALAILSAATPDTDDDDDDDGDDPHDLIHATRTT